jgi:soluble lytic murein transglycosylase
MARAAVVATLMTATASAARAGRATPAERLGQAYDAYDAGDVDGAAALLDGLDADDLVNDDYLHWLRGQVALLRGEPAAAKRAFEALAKAGDSRFARDVPWRLADCAWELGDRAAAARAYEKLLATEGAVERADLAVVRLRIAEAKGTKKKAAAKAAYREIVLEHPTHPAAAVADARLVALGGERAARLSADDHLARAQNLTGQHLWHEAVAELMLIDPDDVSASLRKRRTYWLGTTLFKMRRRYGDAGAMLLSVYRDMGDVAAEAMFRGARALSRADRDDEAIAWYRKVVATYPKTSWAEEAQYLSGWLEFNRGNYERAIGPLEESLRRYPKSKWADEAVWFLGMSKYLLGRLDDALPHFERLAGWGGALQGGKGRYWKARTLQRLGRDADARDTYRGVVKRWPFSWYALLSVARLDELGVAIGPFGVDDPRPQGPDIATDVDEGLADDRLIEGADELIAAGLGVEAGEELRRGEGGFLGRHPRGKALAMLMDRYRRAGNFHRPWMLALVRGEAALDGPAKGTARVWWEHAYPRAFRELVDEHQHLGGSPDHYLYSIMRKESGFDRHVLSYADAQGLLQMIPATTKRVAAALGLPYDPGKLYDPEFNIMTGSWYIGRLLSKFKGQIPLGAGSYNSGPRPVMKWLDQNGDRPIDELVELVSYTQTREYMKKVTENYARYVYLYEDRVYAQPLVVDKAYRVDEITY